MNRLLLPLGCLLLTACVPSRPTQLDDARVRALVEQARTAQAETLAPIEYRFARKKLELWKQAVDERERGRAAMLLEQAEMDARLALTKSRAARAVQEMNRLNEDVKKLQAQLDQLQGELQ